MSEGSEQIEQDEKEVISRGKGRWIHNDTIYVDYGKSYGLWEDGRTISLGTIYQVENYFKRNEIGELNQSQIKVLNDIKEMEDLSNGDQSRVEQSSNFRSRPTRDFKHRATTTKRATITKRLPVCKAKFTQPSLPPE
jgi:hypothetical protein